MTGMRASLKVLMHCFRTCRIVDSLRVLALEVRGEHSMDSAAMNMARIPMTMICLGMHVEEWNHEHPRDQPEHGKYTDSRHA
jgi:hypothetical protein